MQLRTRPSVLQHRVLHSLAVVWALHRLLRTMGVAAGRVSATQARPGRAIPPELFGFSGSVSISCEPPPEKERRLSMFVAPHSSIDDDVNGDSMVVERVSRSGWCGVLVVICRFGEVNAIIKSHHHLKRCFSSRGRNINISPL